MSYLRPQHFVAKYDEMYYCSSIDFELSSLKRLARYSFPDDTGMVVYSFLLQAGIALLTMAADEPIFRDFETNELPSPVMIGAINSKRYSNTEGHMWSSISGTFRIF